MHGVFSNPQNGSRGSKSHMDAGLKYNARGNCQLSHQIGIQGTPSVPNYKAPFNFAGQWRTSLTMIYIYNMSTKLIYTYMKWKNLSRRIQWYILHILNPYSLLYITGQSWPSKTSIKIARLIIWDGGSTISSSNGKRAQSKSVTGHTQLTER